MAEHLITVHSAFLALEFGLHVADEKVPEVSHFAQSTSPLGLMQALKERSGILHDSRLVHSRFGDFYWRAPGRALKSLIALCVPHSV